MRANARNTIRNGYTRQRGAPAERLRANACDTIGDGDTRQGEATIESSLANARNAIGDGDTRQRGAPTERPIANARDAIGNGKTRQRGAIIENMISNACDTVFYCNTSQIVTFIERLIANGRNFVPSSIIFEQSRNNKIFIFCARVSNLTSVATSNNKVYRGNDFGIVIDTPKTSEPYFHIGISYGTGACKPVIVFKCLNRFLFHKDFVTYRAVLALG